MIEVLDKRWRTILELQQRLQTISPGSPEAEIIEHAISLAIDSRNPEKNLKFFRHDIIRNARFSLRRTKARQSRLWEKVSLFSPAWTEDAETYIAQELEAKLQAIMAGSGKNLSQCFNDMLNDRSVAATAFACDVSLRTANRLRQKVRNIVQTYLDTQEGA